MIKEAMQSSGANATKKHLEEIYVPCFYWVDRMWGVSQSVAVILLVINKMVWSEGVTKEKPAQQSFSF